MKQYTLSEDKLKELIYWSHSYGRSMQFNYGLFGPDCDHANPFSEDKAAEYCMADIEKSVLGNHLSEVESDLLEALQNLLSSYRADFRIITGAELNDTEAVKKANAAIQKATK